MKKKVFILLIVLSSVLIFFLYNIYSRSNDLFDKYELLEINEFKTENKIFIKGKIKNNTFKTIPYLQVGIPIYNKNGDLIHTSYDIIYNFKPGKIFNFNILASTNKEDEILWEKEEVIIEAK